MKILINASTIRVGGGIQVARTVIEQSIGVADGHEFRFAVSPEVADTLEPDILDGRTVLVNPSPARFLRGLPSRNLLEKLESDFCPDVVFTIFGPAYWRPRSPHLCGVGSAWLLAPSEVALSVFPWRRRVQKKAESTVKRFFLRRSSGFVVETEAMRELVVSRFPGFADMVWVIPNTCAPEFQGQKAWTGAVLPQKKPGEFRVVTLSSYLPHKNLEIIPDIARELSVGHFGSQATFYLSLPHTSSGWLRIREAAQTNGVSPRIVNVGPVSPREAPLFYQEADAMLMPSLIESFSATYAEAMALAIPIVTTDLPFAHAICKTAALYYPPRSARAAAGRIAELMTNPSLARTLATLAHARYRDFPTPRRKLEMYLEACRDLVSKRKPHST